MLCAISSHKDVNKNNTNNFDKKKAIINKYIILLGAVFAKERLIISNARNLHMRVPFITINNFEGVNTIIISVKTAVFVLVTFYFTLLTLLFVIVYLLQFYYFELFIFITVIYT